MNKSFGQLMLLHWREFFREPEILFWTIGFPIVLAGVLGLAFMNKGTIPQTVGLLAAEQSEPALIRLTEQLQAPVQQPLLKQLLAPTIRIRHYQNQADALIALKRGDIPLFMTWDATKQQPHYHFDPNHSEAKALYHVLVKKLSATTVDHQFTALQTPGLRYIDFLIPGLIAMGIMQSCLWAIGWSLIDRRIKKMLRRMVATPLNRYMFLFSYYVNRVLISIIEIILLVLFAVLVFKIELQGSWLAFFVLILCGNFAFFGISILMASRAKNAQVGNGLLNAIALPMMILSGIFFSYKNFPEWSQPIVEVLPLTILADHIRKVFIEGAGLTEVLIPSLILCAFGLFTLVIGQRLFKWY